MAYRHPRRPGESLIRQRKGGAVRRGVCGLLPGHGEGRDCVGALSERRLLKAKAGIEIEGNMKALKWIGVICLVPVVLVAGSCVRNKVIGPVGWATDDVEKALRAQMKDPDSMVIRSSYVVKRQTELGQEISICGFVDGRNSFGAYSGPVRFVSKSLSNRKLEIFETSLVKLENPTETKQSHSFNMLSVFEDMYWNNYCVDAAHPALTVSSVVQD